MFGWFSLQIARFSWNIWKINSRFHWISIYASDSEQFVLHVFRWIFSRFKIYLYIRDLINDLDRSKYTYCFLHRQAPTAKVLLSDLNDVLMEVIEIVNSIKGKTLQTRLFTIICEDMSSLHHNLLYHTEVMWLSKKRYWQEF